MLPLRSCRTSCLPEHRGRKGRIREGLRGVRLEGGDRRGLERDVAHPLALAVEEVHLRGVVLAVPDDSSHRLPVGAGIPDAPEGVVGDDALDEVVKRRYGGDRDGEVPDRRFVHGLLHEVCHVWYLLTAQPSGAVPSRKMLRIFRGLHAPGNVTDDYRVYPGGYQPDFIEEPGLGFDSQI